MEAEVGFELAREQLRKGNLSSVLGAIQHYRDEIVNLRALLRVRAVELANVRDAYQRVEDERDALRRRSAYIRRWFELHGLREVYDTLERKYRVDSVIEDVTALRR